MRETFLRLTLPALLLTLGAGFLAPAPAAAEARNPDSKWTASLVPLVERHKAALKLREDGIRPPQETLRKLESAFVRLLAQAPDDPRIGEAVHDFYYGWCYAIDGPASPALLDILGRAHDPTALALRLAGCHKLIDVVLAAAEAEPGAVGLWIQAAQLADEPALKIKLREEVLRHLAAPGRPLQPAEPDAVLAIAADLLQQQLSSGLIEEASQTFQSLPPEARDRLMKGEQGEIRTEVQGQPLIRYLPDLRIELTAAFLLTGQTAAAVELLQANDARSDNDSLKLLRRIAQVWMVPSPDDPFPLLTDILNQWALFRTSSTTSQLLVARLAERESYPDVAIYFLRQCAFQLGHASTPDTRLRFGPARLQETVHALERQIAGLKQSLEAEIQDLERTRQASLPPDPAPDTVSRLLRAPSRVRFQENRLPAGMAPVEPVDEPVGLPQERREARTGQIAAPAGFQVVRSETDGNRTVAICSSQAYDPPGGLSQSAYWVLLSSDGGKTWAPPLYTGLQAKLPYVVRRHSLLPLLAGDRLQVEVESLELETGDYALLSGPRTKQTERGIFLEIPLALLRQDSDRDGLTDIAEERLLLDPENADTDGDGLSDGTDPLPGVPAVLTASRRTRALDAFLTKILVRRPAGREETCFFVGDRSLFAGIQPDRRLVVLTREETRTVREKAGELSPTFLDLFVFDRSGKKARAVWASAWEGGQVDLTENEGTWTAGDDHRWMH